MSTRLVLKKVRFSYCNLFKPRAPAGSEPKFSCSLLIPKDHPELPKIREAIATELDAKWPDKKKRPAGLHNPLRDGDAERPNDPAYVGHFFLNANAKVDFPPTVVDGQKRPVLDLTYWGSGDHGNAIVDFYAFNNEAKKGVAVGLTTVQFVKKGEPLSGRGDPLAGLDIEEDADDITA